MEDKKIDPEVEKRIIENINLSTFKGNDIPYTPDDVLKTRKRVMGYLKKDEVHFEKKDGDKFEGPWS
jgi:hypothetical protein